MVSTRFLFVSPGQLPGMWSDVSLTSTDAPYLDYFQNMSQWPDAAAQEELAERVRGVPGCEFYTARQVYAYFGNNRARIRSDGKDATLPTGDSTKRGRRKKGM